MRCEQLEKNIQAYADGELNERETGVLEAHLKGCSKCRQDLESRLKMRRVFQGEPRETAPDGLCERVLVAVAVDMENERESENQVVRKRIWWHRARIPLTFAAAAVLTVVLLGRPTTDPEDPSEAVAPFSRPSRIVVLRYGERVGEDTPVKFGGIDLTRMTEGRSQ